MNMSILGEMLTELKPGEEQPDDYQLLTDLSATCKYVSALVINLYKLLINKLIIYREMQSRIVDLIGRVTDDELTAELLRINDELNNLFLRHQRYEKNRSSHTGVTSPSAVLGAAIGIPPSNAGAAAAVGGAVAEPPKLLDFPDSNKDDLLNSFSRLGIYDDNDN